MLFQLGVQSVRVCATSKLIEVMCTRGRFRTISFWNTSKSSRLFGMSQRNLAYRPRLWTKTKCFHAMRIFMLDIVFILAVVKTLGNSTRCAHCLRLVGCHILEPTLSHSTVNWQSRPLKGRWFYSRCRLGMFFSLPSVDTELRVHHKHRVN